VTERKPPGVSWETWIDRAIEEGRRAGAFEDLPGKGRPLDGLDRPRDDDWWVKQKLRDEGISFLPPTLALRKDVEDTRARIRATTTETEARRLVEELNGRIRAVNRTGAAGPPSTVMPLDLERELGRWRSERQGPTPGSGRKDDPAQR
jgi:hypothetical protein